MASLFQTVGKGALIHFENIGRFGILITAIFKALRETRFYLRRIPEQMLWIGNHSLPIVVTTAAFSGMVASVQSAYQITGYVPLYLVGSVVGESMLLELGPVVTALVLAGRVGASIAAELGTMRVTEQIDALESLAINPVAFLVVPRVIAGLVMLPVLTVFADFVGIVGGWLISVTTMELTTTEFFKGFRMFFIPWDAIYGIIKSAFFGVMITLIGCYEGFHTSGGAEGVGRATTRAVVAACLAILMLDYILAALLL
ncbi:MAG: ABC transporter permease [candidate division KSB1 bacterium]|nr:ABC transporter permease [candidate division KSB1 bacterium]MDZ7301113.1 ABC transporter permease [candidate division KSB1 bacterium]MDZ7312002.1 ABC transporter permease [candidate division KSB1 bacterium]